MSQKLSESVRIGHSLNEHEELFVKKRIQTVQQFLNRHDIQCPLDKVPKIAILGSGGGERAMVGLLGSLVELKNADILDCALYLSGVSGSTWCMASVYQEANWSTDLDSVTEKIIQRLSGPGVSWSDAFSKLKKYYYEKDIYSLTDIWAVMVVTSFVKEIDEHTLSEQQGLHDLDPFPIYTVIDKKCKQQQDEADVWVELTPEEAGYSLTGAFVDVSQFGSQFQNGTEIKHQPEIDMLYLQALCGSALADKKVIKAFLLKKIKEFFGHIIHVKETIFGEKWKDITPPIEDCYQVLMDLVEMNLLVLKSEDTSALEERIRAKLKELAGGKSQLIFEVDKLEIDPQKKAEEHMMHFTMDVCTNMRAWFSIWPFDVWMSTMTCVAKWRWGRKYNFLHKMTDKRVPVFLHKSETRDYMDAGLYLNSPYFSVLRQERDVDIIISLDFSDGDPFTTVENAADLCKKLQIPFPKVTVPENDHKTPKDFYVFEGYEKAPTVIHIPLFNTVNCGGDIEGWRKRYSTIQDAYPSEKIKPLLDVAGKNITNNKEKLLEVIRKIIKAKRI